MGDYNRKFEGKFHEIHWQHICYSRSPILKKNTFKLIHNQSRTKCRWVYNYISKLNFLMEATAITLQLIHFQKKKGAVGCSAKILFVN